MTAAASPQLHRSRHGMVSSSSPLATLSALEVLGDGGTAFDAGLTAAAVLNVALPMSCGVGGDVVALVYEAAGQHLWCLSGLGAAPSGAAPEAFRRQGLTAIPRIGILAATVPATLESYVRFHERFCTRPLARLLAPAMGWAEDGVVVSEQLHQWIANNVATVARDAWLTARFLPGGEPLAVGAVLRQPELALTYKHLAALGPDLLADAWLLERLGALVRAEGTLFTPSDLTRPQCRIGPPLGIDVAGVTVLTTRLPTQGYLLLQNLALYARAAADGQTTAPAGRIHALAEIYNQTFGERLRRTGDPDFVEATDDLLAPETLNALYKSLDFARRTAGRVRGFWSEGDTTYFAVVDSAGNAVSWMQSLSLGFGAGVSLPTLGMILNNRLGRSATLDPSHANGCAPGKRPVSTLAPYMVVSDGRLRLVGGTPGGDGQAQWNSAFLAAVLVDGEPLGRAIAAPRFTVLPGSDLIERDVPEVLDVDGAMPAEICRALESRGHRVLKTPRMRGALRVLQVEPDHVLGTDDGREEGLTLGR